jgi:hypothetical protein
LIIKKWKSREALFNQSKCIRRLASCYCLLVEWQGMAKHRAFCSTYCTQWGKNCFKITKIFNWFYSIPLLYKGSPDSTIFVLPGNRTIAKIILSGDWFSTKIAIYDFWIFKVPFFSCLMLKKGQNWLILPHLDSSFERHSKVTKFIDDLVK